MKIELKEVKVIDVFDQYADLGDDGVFGYHGLLDIRPPYQRELVYDEPEMQAVIHTVLNGFPLNIMYWVKKEDGKFEVLDGQQRTLSLMKYLSHDFQIIWKGHSYYWDSLPDDELDKIYNYKLMVYVCEGSNSEKKDWFRTVNIAGERLTDQELQNSIYTGTWLSAAKKIFSKRNCAAKLLSDKYVKGDPNRQELLETAIKWICDKQGIEGDDPIGTYMSTHQHDSNADELWTYYQSVIDWINRTFPKYRKEMKGLPWGPWYNQYSNNSYSPTSMESEIARLMSDDDVTSQKGIYHYLLAIDETESSREKYLSIRAFDNRTKRNVYEKQRGICAICHKHFEFDEMHADHIKPWSRGGHTVIENCQMLCRDCNLQKSAQ